MSAAPVWLLYHRLQMAFGFLSRRSGGGIARAESDRLPDDSRNCLRMYALTWVRNYFLKYALSPVHCR